MKTSNVLSVLINDVMDDSPKESGRFPSEVRSFSLHALIKDAGCVSRCLCADKCFDFAIEVDRTLPDQVMGDERRVFQVILHMVGNLLDNNKGGGKLTFRVFLQHGSQGKNDQRWFQLHNSVVRDEAVRHMKETLASSSVKSLFK
ncbi:Enoyl-[acyl-carrier-protein] reductase [NADPH, B-specific] 2, mitochondrial [Ancistrocladus abbreviatus]